ncbi:DUF3256 family protein [uncultured Bacteroides sp.]|uniref:DUF3256 family protein n=1 Tax=uncultured Bacteroides sp. TaxID=162156 RepID=UPI002AA8D28D|nr:DUF3256 family protein [uncultured Bacteroides sp.]
MKKNLLLLFFMLPAIFVKGQEAKTLFVNMPDSLSPILTAVNRADCIDFLNSKMKAQVKNKFDNMSEMTELAPDYIRMKMSDRSDWQMKLLATTDSTKVICTVATACGPACDSEVRFFTTNWKELPASKFLTVPAMDDFFQVPDSTEMDKYNRLRSQADMLLLKADFSKANDTLTFTFATVDYMEKDEAEKLKPFLRSPLVYVWQQDTRSFVRK